MSVNAILWQKTHDITVDKLKPYGYQKNRIDKHIKNMALDFIFGVIHWREVENSKFVNFSFVNAFVKIEGWEPGATTKWWLIFLKTFVCTQWVTCHSRKKNRMDLRR